MLSPRLFVRLIPIASLPSFHEAGDAPSTARPPRSCPVRVLLPQRVSGFAAAASRARKRARHCWAARPRRRLARQCSRQERKHRPKGCLQAGRHGGSQGDQVQLAPARHCARLRLRRALQRRVRTSTCEEAEPDAAAEAARSWASRARATDAETTVSCKSGHTSKVGRTARGANPRRAVEILALGPMGIALGTPSRSPLRVDENARSISERRIFFDDRHPVRLEVERHGSHRFFESRARI